MTDDIRRNLEQIYYDHPYAFSETHHRDSTKHYFLSPSVHSLRVTSMDTTENVDVEAIVDSAENEDVQCQSHYTALCDFILKSLYGEAYVTKVDNDLKSDLSAVDLSERSKCRLSYKSDDWTISDKSLRIKLYSILEEGHGSLVVIPANVNDVCFRAVIRRISKRISHAYSSTHWRMDVCSSVHAHLLEELPDELLVVYIECMRHLSQRVKMKTILEHLNTWAQNQRILQRFSWPNVLDICHREIKQESSDLSELKWPLDVKLKPVVIHIYSERWAESVRMTKFSSRLRLFCNVSEFKFDDSGRLRKKFETMRSLLQTELKYKRSPVFVMGWDLGALLGLLSSIKIHGINAANFTGVICVGLPLKGLKGERGIIPEDYIHLLSKETLIISGDMSGIGNGDDIEDFKDRMKGRVCIRQINIGGCDHILRLSSGYALRYQLSQEIVDMTILKEIKNFIVDQISSSFVQSDDNVDLNYSRNVMVNQSSTYSSDLFNIR